MKTYILRKTCTYYNKYFRFTCVWNWSGHTMTAWKTQLGVRAANETQEMANKNELNTSLEGLTIQFTVWTLLFLAQWNPTIWENYWKTPERFKMQVFRKNTQRIPSSIKRQEATCPNHKDTTRKQMFMLLRLRPWWCRQCMLKKSMQMAPWECHRDKHHMGNVLVWVSRME